MVLAPFELAATIGRINVDRTAIKFRNGNAAKLGAPEVRCGGLGSALCEEGPAGYMWEVIEILGAARLSDSENSDRTNSDWACECPSRGHAEKRLLTGGQGFMATKQPENSRPEFSSRLRRRS